MCHRPEPKKEPEKPFPHYDEVTHIDSAAIVPDFVRIYGEPRVDPKSTEYTERYCKPQ